MMVRFKYETDEAADAVLREAVWLAWQLAGGPTGMGVLADKPGATKDEVWANAVNAADYPGKAVFTTPSFFNADYVFGRKVKIRANRPAPGVLLVHTPPPATAWHDQLGSVGELFRRAALAAQVREVEVAPEYSDRW